MKTNPDGSIAASFPGGVILPVTPGFTNPTGNPNATRSVRWDQESNGAYLASIITQKGASTTDPTFMKMEAVQPGNPLNSRASVTLTASDQVNPSSKVGAQAWSQDPAHQQNVTIIDADGNSSFMQYNSTFGQLQFSQTFVNLVWPGGTAASAFIDGIITVTPPGSGKTITPLAWGINQIDQSGVGPVSYYGYDCLVNVPSAGEIDVRGHLITSGGSPAAQTKINGANVWAICLLS